MYAFDRIYGYRTVKQELRQIADILQDQRAYEKLGVSAPRGLLLHGKPGVGKSLMAQAVIEASGRKAFVFRKDQPNGDFVRQIKETFEKAMANAPSIVLLDDMDKFANGDERRPDAEEYVTVQACIDEAKGKEVFVLATVNRLHCLPRSLYRAGRFDRVIQIEAPRGKDALAVVGHFLSGKQLARDVDIPTIARIMDGKSCAELETVINEAGLFAGYERAEFITMAHLTEACLRVLYNVPSPAADEELQVEIHSESCPDTRIIYHEAGHAVVSEVLCPESVTLVCIYNRSGTRGGFMDQYDDRDLDPLRRARHRILTGLGGKAAIELRFGSPDMGCRNDLEQALEQTEDLVKNLGLCGLQLCSLSYSDEDSQQLRTAQEQAVRMELERAYRKAMEILSLNREFLEEVAAALAEKKLLCAGDIRRIRARCKIVPVSI